MAKFFVSCALEVVSELETELKEIWPYLLNKEGRAHSSPLEIIEIDKGGILIECEESLGFQINFFSKLANRVLLRLSEFKVKDFPKLYQKFEKIDLPALIGKTDGLINPWQLETSASQSRLNHEKRIDETILSAWKKHTKQAPGERTKVFVRMFDDLCTVSLDTSGKHLHFRGHKHVGEAPLRETLAAFMVRSMMGPAGAAELQEITLIDPMAGSGTLLQEARLLYQGNFSRSFSFLSWPITPKLLKLEKLKDNYMALPKLFKSMQGFDIDQKVFEVLKVQMKEISSEASLQDLFSAKPRSVPGRSWVISNLPYGERIKVSFSVLEAIEQINKVHQPERIGLLMSERQYSDLSNQKIIDFKMGETIALSNGGLRTKFVVFEKTKAANN